MNSAVARPPRGRAAGLPAAPEDRSSCCLNARTNTAISSGSRSASTRALRSPRPPFPPPARPRHRAGDGVAAPRPARRRPPAPEAGLGVTSSRKCLDLLAVLGGVAIRRPGRLASRRWAIDPLSTAGRHRGRRPDRRAACRLNAYVAAVSLQSQMDRPGRGLKLKRRHHQGTGPAPPRPGPARGRLGSIQIAAGRRGKKPGWPGVAEGDRARLQHRRGAVQVAAHQGE